MQLQREALASVADKNPAAEAILTYATIRERAVRGGTISFEAMKRMLSNEGFEFSSQQLLSALREFQRLGVGKIVNGHFFKWDIKITDLGALFKGMVALEPQPHQEPKEEVIPMGLKVVAPTKRMVIVLSEGKEIDLEFTANLSKEDVKFIADKLLKESA